MSPGRALWAQAQQAKRNAGCGRGRTQDGEVGTLGAQGAPGLKAELLAPNSSFPPLSAQPGPGTSPGTPPALSGRSFYNARLEMLCLCRPMW